MSATEAPLVLGRISSGWRNIAFSTSALWTSLHIPLEYVLQRGLEGPITEWLDRSSQSPLSLCIITPPYMYDWIEANSEQGQQGYHHVGWVFQALAQC